MTRLISVIRSWAIPFAVMAAIAITLDTLLKGSGALPYYAAMAAFAVLGGLYVGHKSVAEGREGRSRHRTRRAAH